MVLLTVATRTAGVLVPPIRLNDSYTRSVIKAYAVSLSTVPVVGSRLMLNRRLMVYLQICTQNRDI